MPFRSIVHVFWLEYYLPHLTNESPLISKVFPPEEKKSEQSLQEPVSPAASSCGARGRLSPAVIGLQLLRQVRCRLVCPSSALVFHDSLGHTPRTLQVL